MWPTFIFTGLLLGRWGVLVSAVEWGFFAVAWGIGDCTGSCLPGSFGLALANAAVGALVHELVLGPRVHRFLASVVTRRRERARRVRMGARP